MRSARITAPGECYYHVTSRVIEGRFILGNLERERFRQTMRLAEDFCDVQVLTWCCMSNHFHVLVYIPERQDVDDEEFIRRMKLIYGPNKVCEVERQIRILRDNGQDKAAETYKENWTYRMYDVSEFMKMLKQRFSQWYNTRNERKGPLWEDRFKSVLVEESAWALSCMAAYIDLNPVRAGIVKDPKDYRHCGYAEAVAGNKLAREGLKRVMRTLWHGAEADIGWKRVGCSYRKFIFNKGRNVKLNRYGQPEQGGFTQEELEEVIKQDGKLSMPELLRLRVKYFTYGVIFGSQEFVEKIYKLNREKFGRKRKTGARPMKYGDWDGLYAARDLRKDLISVPVTE